MYKNRVFLWAIATLASGAVSLSQPLYKLKLAEFSRDSEVSGVYDKSEEKDFFWEIDLHANLRIQLFQETDETHSPVTLDGLLGEVRILVFNQVNDILADTVMFRTGSSLPEGSQDFLIRFPTEWNNEKYRFTLFVERDRAWSAQGIDTVRFRKRYFRWRFLVRLDEGIDLEGILATAAKTQVSIAYIGDKKFAESAYSIFHVPFLRAESRKWIWENLELGFEWPVSITEGMKGIGYGVGLGFLRNSEDRTLVHIGAVNIRSTRTQPKRFFWFVGIELPSAIQYIRDFISAHQ
ncbi:MAG: hypothetical protein HY562_09175 [Ignavibacteriales bacterium]|nr:hypothetical protein [Ignavibacteriales bacterium]